MLGSNLPSVEWAGISLGVREAVLGLIVLIGIYVVILLWRTRRQLQRTLQPATPPQAPVVASSPAETVDPVPEPVLPTAAEPPEVHDTALADAVLAQGLQRELTQLRDEVDAIRGELAALRQDMQSELAHFRATQSVSPIYGDAMQMAIAGYDAVMIAERCGIARAEAELVVALAHSQHP